jgi:hypothetical protein
MGNGDRTYNSCPFKIKKEKKGEDNYLKIHEKISIFKD